MKKYTQEEFDNFEIDEYGYRLLMGSPYLIVKTNQGCIKA